MMKGSNCHWAYRGDESGCGTDADCSWYSEPHCEVNETKVDVCFSKSTQTGCESVNGSYCVWATDDFSPQGGRCEYSMFECHWNETLRRSKSDCESNTKCKWVKDIF